MHALWESVSEGLCVAYICGTALWGATTLQQGPPPWGPQGQQQRRQCHLQVQQA